MAITYSFYEVWWEIPKRTGSEYTPLRGRIIVPALSNVRAREIFRNEYADEILEEAERREEVKRFDRDLPLGVKITRTKKK